MSPRPGGDVSNSAEFAVIGTPTETPALTPEQVAEVETKPRLREVGKSFASRIWSEHPTLMFTLLYLALTFVGVVHDFFYYLMFKINVLDYSETGDFLLAALRNPVAVLLSTLPIPLFVALQWWGRTLRKKSGVYNKYQAQLEKLGAGKLPVRVIAAFMFVLVYVVLFTELYSFAEAKRVYDGKGQRVSFLRSDGIASDEQPILLGTTGKFIFLYYPSRKATEIIPIDNMTALTVDSRRRKDRERDSLAAIDTLTN
ncbi:MAG TPA: hypothetical protein VF042_12920 [Gemmatimonadaceae bacterium]